MKNQLRKIFASTLLIITVFTIFGMKLTTLHAQNGVLGQFGLNAQATAFGNAMSSVPDFGAFGFYNPALAAFSSNGIQTDFGSSRMSFDRNLSTIGSSFRLPPNAGIYSYLMGFSVQDIQERSSSGYHIRNFNANELRLGLAFGIQLSERFAAGVGLKINRAQLHPDISTDPSIGLDFGLLFKATQRWYLSFAMLDQFSAYTWDSSSYYGEQQSVKQTENQPLRLVFGTSYRTEKTLASIDFENRRLVGNYQETNVVPLGGIPTTFRDRVSENYWDQTIRFGLTREFHTRLMAQIGYQIPSFDELNAAQWSAGFTLRLPFDALRPQVQYTVVREAQLYDLIHMLGLRITI
jgi:hypothetical protein